MSVSIIKSFYYKIDMYGIIEMTNKLYLINIFYVLFGFQIRYLYILNFSSYYYWIIIIIIFLNI